MKILCPKLVNPIINGDLEVADLCMGWFWQPDKFFSDLDGVVDVIVGYSGGKDPYPTFENKKDHVETVRVIFDPTVIDYDEILENFLEQGGLPSCNRGNYQPAILVHSETQLVKAEAILRMLHLSRVSNVLPIIAGARDFYIAEAHHQKYLRKLSRTMPYDVSWMWSSAALAAYKLVHGSERSCHYVM